MTIREEIRSVLETEYGLTPLSAPSIIRARRISPDAKIGSGVQFGEDVIIHQGVEIGDGVKIGNRVTLRSCRLGEGVRVEDNTIVGYATLTGGFYTQFDELKQVEPTVIGPGTLIRTDCIIYLSVTVGEECRINHKVLLREHTCIGNHTSIGSMTESGGYNVIGSYVNVHSQVHLSPCLELEDYVFVAPFTVFTNGPVGYMRLPPGSEQAPTGSEQAPIIRFGAQIGVNAVVYAPVEVGYESLVASSAVVTKDVPALGIAMGVPARIVGRVPDRLRMPEAIRLEYYKGKLDPDVETTPE